MRRLARPGRLVPMLALAACSTNVAAPVGDGCSTDDVCLTGFCTPDVAASGKSTGWAGGYCAGDCNDSCPQGSTCLDLADGNGYCVAKCEEDGDCRGGYVCDQAVSACLPDCRRDWFCGDELICNSSNGSCELPAGTVEVGGACSSDNDCAEGFCIRDTDASDEPTHWTDGYCSGDCASTCPQGNCLTLADGNKYCVAECAADEDCRRGYVCAKAVAACLPDCREGWSCGSKLVCNSGNGNCEIEMSGG
jgi:hypothetical protein